MLLKTVEVTVSSLLVIFGITVFVGFVVAKQTDLDYKLGEVKTRALTEKEIVTVSRVIDGDTIELTDGRIVRYIGVDAPDAGKCFSRSATKVNQVLVEGKKVALEKDRSEVDADGRLLRYVWVGKTLVNERIVAEGFAESVAVTPDFRYNGQIYNAHRSAREQNLGLWNVCK